MTKRKKLKRVESPTARPKTERIAVSSPTVPGAREEVEFVPDNVDRMRARRLLGRTRAENEFNFRAADRIRNAYTMLHGSVGGTLDIDRVRGHGASPSGPSDSYLFAAEVMRDVKTHLYPVDRRAVELCICEGFLIAEATSIIRRRPATRADREEIGRCLRQGLQLLAERWFGCAGDQRMVSRKIRTWSDPANETTPATAGVVVAGGAYVSRG